VRRLKLISAFPLSAFRFSDGASSRRLLRVATIKPCVCEPVGFPDADVNEAENTNGANQHRINYWRLWLGDTALVTAGLLVFLATHYGTCEFFGAALGMALLPLIPILVLVGGAGSTIFVLTQILIEKRGLKRPVALALLVGPALAVTALLVLLGAVIMPAHRLSYLCLGHAPASASQVRLTGYSTFLREEWLAVFQVDQTSFQTFVTGAELAPADEFEFQTALESSKLKTARLGQSLPPLTNALCFKRVFKESQEHQRGNVIAVFDPATSTAIVLRGYHD
jgi:hypothetical protein